MKAIPKAVYRTPAQIEEGIRELELNSMRLRADTDEHRQIMKRIAQLQVYADAKRWLSRPIKWQA